MSAQPAVLEDLDWPKDALNMLTAYAASGLVFSAEDLRDSMRPAPNPSQVGTAFREAHRLGIIRPTGYKESSTPSRRHGVIRVWRGNNQQQGEVMSEQAEQSEVFVDRFYEMNPDAEDLVAGDQLENGHVVLIEDCMIRENVSRVDSGDGYALKRLRENNQWCRVSSLQRRGDLVSFVGVYEDGVKRPRTFHQSYYWIVRA